VAAVAGNYDITLTGSVSAGSWLAVSKWLQIWASGERILVATLPSATGSVACVAATRICSLVVQWDDSRGLSGSGAEQFTLTLRLP
jgi:type IV pilus assembly protein PilV